MFISTRRRKREEKEKKEIQRRLCKHPRTVLGPTGQARSRLQLLTNLINLTVIQPKLTVVDVTGQIMVIFAH